MRGIVSEVSGGSLIQSEAHTRKDLMGGASLDDVKSLVNCVGIEYYTT